MPDIRTFRDIPRTHPIPVPGRSRMWLVLYSPSGPPHLCGTKRPSTTVIGVATLFLTTMAMYLANMVSGWARFLNDVSSPALGGAAWKPVGLGLPVMAPAGSVHTAV